MNRTSTAWFVGKPSGISGATDGILREDSPHLCALRTAITRAETDHLVDIPADGDILVLEYAGSSDATTTATDRLLAIVEALAAETHAAIVILSAAATVNACRLMPHTVIQCGVDALGQAPNEHCLPPLVTDEGPRPRPTGGFSLVADRLNDLSLKILRTAAMVGPVHMRIGGVPEPRSTAGWALCPTERGGDISSVVQAMANGQVPIIFNAGKRLPLDDALDYGSFAFCVGQTDAELAIIQTAAATDVAIRRRLARRARRAWEKHFTPTAVGEAMRRMIPRFARRTDAPVTIEPATEGTPLTSLTLVDESELFERLWQRLGQDFPRSAKRPLVIFGAGKFCRRLLSAAAMHPGGPVVSVIVDDNASPGAALAGIPVKLPAAVSPTDFGAVFLATDAMEADFASRCREVYGDSVEILLPSRLIAEALANRDQDAKQCASPSLASRPMQTPRRIDAVLVCAGYGDFLAWTLRNNLQHFDRFVVVTASQDLRTQEIARDAGANVVISEVYREDGTSFNKGRMLNEGFDALDDAEWVLITDADILLPAGFRQRLASRTLHPDLLYYATRLDAPSENTPQWLNHYLLGSATHQQLGFEQPGANRMPWGYFQLVHRDAACLRDRSPAVYPPDYPTAGDVDYAFMELWPKQNRVLLPEVVIHIPHGTEGTNWSGRQSPPLPPPTSTPP